MKRINFEFWFKTTWNRRQVHSCVSFIHPSTGWKDNLEHLISRPFSLVNVKRWHKWCHLPREHLLFHHPFPDACFMTPSQWKNIPNPTPFSTLFEFTRLQKDGFTLRLSHKLFGRSTGLWSCFNQKVFFRNLITIPSVSTHIKYKLVMTTAPGSISSEQ